MKALSHSEFASTNPEMREQQGLQGQTLGQYEPWTRRFYFSRSRISSETGAAPLGGWDRVPFEEVEGLGWRTMLENRR